MTTMMRNVIAVMCTLAMVGCAVDPSDNDNGRKGIDGECPDPADPDVTYLSDALCDETPVRFLCGDEEESFDNDCGCGCIAGGPIEVPTCPDPEDPTVHYMDDALCADLPPFPCGDEQALFNDECGCGCIDAEWPPVEGPLATGFEAELTETRGCADLQLGARTPDDTIALIFMADGYAAAAHELGETISVDLELPVDMATLEVRVGEHLTHLFCNDVMEMEPVIEAVYRPVSGSATLVVTPTGETTPWGEVPAMASLTLSNIVLESDADGEAVVIEHFELNDIFVGWLPG